jgi:streptomycin 6-kinase
MDGIPDVVRNKALVAGASAWLDALPTLVAEFEAEWSIVVGDAYEGGTEAFVAEATCADGSPAVLKLVVPRAGDAARDEAIALQLAGGDGCAQLYRWDETRGVLLLERLGPSLYSLGWPAERRHAVLCATASRVWRPAADNGLRTGATKGAWLCEFIATMWDALDHPCSEHAVDDALACAQRRIAAHDDERAVLVHGDVHQWNALVAGDGFKLVDPDGLLAEPEYDLGTIMREDPLELLEGDPLARAHTLAAHTGLDVTAIWEWGVVERVSSGLLCTQLELQPVGREMLLTADRVAGLTPTK